MARDTVLRLASKVVARLVLTALIGLAPLYGCATPRRLPAVPTALESQAAPLPGPIRFLVLRDTSGMVQEGLNSLTKERAWLAAQGKTGPLPPMYMLAISGGGDDGAFGAGLLNGWTAAGTRPEFKVVTGVSTGALIAPFAFLGPKYDQALRDAYTEVSQRDIFKPRSLLRGVFGDAMADTTPLHNMLRRQVDQAMLDAIAAEYAKGRLLLVGTTNLDTLEPVIWNMTAIAASKDPRAPELFRKILLASSAIPGAFPPVLIDVWVNGVHYQEMQVDGGATTQVFLYPPNVRLYEKAAAAGAERQRTLYIIRNARLDADWASVRRRTLPIATRAVSSLLQTQGIGDLYRIYLTTQRDGIDYNLAYIPSTFDTPRNGQFDTAYMRALFQTGYDMAARGFPWEKHPPGYAEPVRNSSSAEPATPQATAAAPAPAGAPSP
jgi:hypothetical protein